MDERILLRDFFKLDDPYLIFDESKIEWHFKTSKSLNAVLYKPDNWPDKHQNIKGHQFTNVSFSKTKFSELTFTNCKFEDCLFIGTEFHAVEFHKCAFVNCNFHKCTFENCYINPTSISFDKKIQASYSNIGLHLYQQIREDASKARQHEFASNADFEFQRWKRWQLRYELDKKNISQFEFCRKKWASLLYEYATGFGYRPTRFVGATIIVFTIISILNRYLLDGSLMQDGKILIDMSFADAIFYTYSMTTALGFSTINAITPAAKLAAVGEALFGIGWLGIFTSLLVKRFIR